MKLTYKIPLIFTLIIMVVFLILIFFLGIYFKDYYFQYITDRSKELVQENFMIIRDVDQLQQSPDQLESYLMERSKKTGIQLKYYSSESGVQMQAGELKEGYLTFEQTFPTYQNGQPVGELTILRQADLLADFGVGQLLNKTVLVFLFVILILFFLLSFYSFQYITKPIHDLNKHLSQVNVKRKPIPLRKREHGRGNEINALYEHVYHMEKRLYEAQEEQVHLISSITHDLKTPLTSMQGFIELLESDAISKEKRERYFQLIKQKAVDIRKLIDVFSSYTKNEYALLDLKTEPIQVGSFFESVAEEYKEECEGLDVYFRYEHVFSEKDWIDANSDLLRRVIANLVSNAIRYADCESLTITFTGYKEEGMAHFVIEDDGIGVENKDLPKLFSKFYTVDQARQAEQGGSGLGLAICRTITERHGGHIEAFPSRFGGLGIRFTIPLCLKKDCDKKSKKSS